jgi:hypothetical protein
MLDWTYLVGIPGVDPKNIILTEDSTLNVIILPENSPVTRDYRLDRVFSLLIRKERFRMYKEKGDNCTL